MDLQEFLKSMGVDATPFDYGGVARAASQFELNEKKVVVLEYSLKLDIYVNGEFLSECQKKPENFQWYIDYIKRTGTD